MRDDLASLSTGEFPEGVCSPCMTLALFASTCTPEADMSSAATTFESRYVEQVQQYRSGFGQAVRRKTEARAADLLTNAAQALSRVGKRGGYFQFCAGQPRSNVEAPYFEINSSKSPFADAACKWALAATAENCEASFLRQLLMEANASFEFEMGYCGLGFLWDTSTFDRRELLTPYLTSMAWQHPGLMSPDPLSQGHRARAGLVDIGWITLLGARRCADAGGVDGILGRLSPSARQKIVAHAWPSGAATFTCGERPGLAWDSEDVLLRRELGAALRMIWNGDENARTSPFGLGGDAATRSAWINRFFDAERFERLR